MGLRRWYARRTVRQRVCINLIGYALIGLAVSLDLLWR